MKQVATSIAKSATTLGPLDAVFGAMDFADGKRQGEDNIRAGGGAIASTAGGLGGAVIGGTLGSALGPVGTVAGAMIGGGIGDFASGYLFDRTDELVRGKKGQRNLTAPAAGAAAGGAGILALSKLSRNKNMNPQIEQQMRLRGINPSAVRAAEAAGNFAGNAARGAGAVGGYAAGVAGNAARGVGNFAGNAAGAVGRYGPLRSLGVAGAVAGGAYLANEMLGNPVGRAGQALSGAVDAVTGNDEANYRQQAADAAWATAGYQPTAMNDVQQREDQIWARDAAHQEYLADKADRVRREYELDRDTRGYYQGLGMQTQNLEAQREQNFAGLQSTEAIEKLRAMNQVGNNVANQLASISQMRYY